MGTSINKGMNHFLLLLLVLAIIFSIFTVVRLSSMGFSLQTFLIGDIRQPSVEELPKDGSFPDFIDQKLLSVGVALEGGDFSLYINGKLNRGESPEQPTKLSMNTLMQGLTASGNAYANPCPSGQTLHSWGPHVFDDIVYSAVYWCQ